MMEENDRDRTPIASNAPARCSSRPLVRIMRRVVRSTASAAQASLSYAGHVPMHVLPGGQPAVALAVFKKGNKEIGEVVARNEPL